MNIMDFDVLAINISGGKDSQTILGVIMAQVKEHNYGGRVVAVHADTGAEWPQSLPHCEMLCKHHGIELQVALPFRNLPDHIERRCKIMAARSKPGWPSPAQRYCTSHCKVNAIEKALRKDYPAKGQPGWPSPAQRYCTSDCKRGPIQKVIRQAYPAVEGKNILCITGERRQESSHRAKLAEWEEDKMLTAGSRKVMRYRPILGYSLDDVWKHIADSGLPRHVAYDLGNERVSCAICMLAKDNDIRNGAAARPDLAERFLRIEEETGFTMKHKKSLKQILEEKQ